MAAMETGYPKLTGERDGYAREAQWTVTTADPKGDGIALPEWADCTWHAKGTFGGATVTVETAPTDTDADYAPCKSAAGGAAIALTALGVATNIERSVYVRPRLNPAGAGASVVVHLLMRRTNPMRT